MGPFSRPIWSGQWSQPTVDSLSKCFTVLPERPTTRRQPVGLCDCNGLAYSGEVLAT